MFCTMTFFTSSSFLWTVANLRAGGAVAGRTAADGRSAGGALVRLGSVVELELLLDGPPKVLVHREGDRCLPLIAVRREEAVLDVVEEREWHPSFKGPAAGHP